MSDIFTCPFCHLRFGLRSEFEDHLKVEHADRRQADHASEPGQP